MPHYLRNNFAERRDARGDLYRDAARTLSIFASVIYESDLQRM